MEQFVPGAECIFPIAVCMSPFIINWEIRGDDASNFEISKCLCRYFVCLWNACTTLWICYCPSSLGLSRRWHRSLIDSSSFQVVFNPVRPQLSAAVDYFIIHLPYTCLLTLSNKPERFCDPLGQRATHRSLNYRQKFIACCALMLGTHHKVTLFCLALSLRFCR